MVMWNRDAEEGRLEQVSYRWREQILPTREMGLRAPAILLEMNRLVVVDSAIAKTAAVNTAIANLP